MNRMLDQLTHTLEHEFFDYLLKVEVKKSVRYLYFFSLAYVQLDLREKIPSQSEEILLPTVASLIKNVVRETDSIGRVGPNTFSVILHQADYYTAGDVGNRIRERIGQYVFRINGTHIQQTVSLGIASFPSHANDLDTLVQRTEHALNSAKKAGGNRVSFPSAGFDQGRNTL